MLALLQGVVAVMLCLWAAVRAILEVRAAVAIRLAVCATLGVIPTEGIVTAIRTLFNACSEVLWAAPISCLVAYGTVFMLCLSACGAVFMLCLPAQWAALLVYLSAF